MKIKNIFKQKLITCDINDNLEMVSKLMKDNDIGFLPITDHNKIVGVITDRDIVIRGIALDTKDLQLIMSTNLVCIDINKSIDEAFNLYIKHRIKRLLITENNNIIGVLSISDILKSDYQKERILEVIKNIFSESSVDNNVEIDTFYL